MVQNAAPADLFHGQRSEEDIFGAEREEEFDSIYYTSSDSDRDPDCTIVQTLR